MDFFKLIKTLNSAQSSWQVALAIVLGLISGFLPLTTPLNFFLLFIAFTINIPLAIFFFMSVLFSGLALVLDPVFASLGYEVLTATGMNDTFTAMYNYAPTLWSSFNYTLLMGSLLISLPLALTLFPILKSLIDKYRDVLEAKFKESKYFSWLNPYSEKNLAKKPGFLRVWAAGLFVLIVALLATIILFLIDPVIKYALESSLSKATQRVVQIDSVESKLLEAKLEITNLSLLSNSLDNSDINIDKIELQLNTKHLLEKKTDFEIISFGNISFHKNITKRVEQTEETATSSTNDEKTDSTFDAPKLPDVDDLIAKEGLKSVAAAKEIETNVQAITQKWKTKLQGDTQKKKIASLEKRVKDLESKAKNVKDIGQITSILSEADKLKKDIEGLDKELAELNAEYKKDKKLLTRYVKEIQTLPMQDYNHLLSKYSLDQNGAMNLIGTHFSASLEKYLHLGSKYYEMVKPYISSEEEQETPEQKRMQGRWIKYANTEPYPDFVIQELTANIIFKTDSYQLKVRDISDDQKLYKKPLTGRVTSKSDNYKKFDVNFEHNELSNDTLSSLNADIQEYKLGEFQAIDTLMIKKALVSEKSRLKITNFEAIDAKIALDFKKTQLVYSASDSLVNTAIKDILSNISSFNVDSSIGGTLTKPSISLSSDLDKKLMKGLKKQASKEVQKYKKELKVAINKEFKKQVGDLNIEGFDEIGDLLDSNKDASKTLEKLLEKNVSKDAMQKQLQSGALKSLGSQLKLF